MGQIQEDAVKVATGVATRGGRSDGTTEAQRLLMRVGWEQVGEVFELLA